MFGLSVGKLIVLIVVVLGVWYGYKWLGRVQKLNRERERERARLAASKGAEDMVRCAFCESYVTAEGARHCGRANCPYPR